MSKKEHMGITYSIAMFPDLAPTRSAHIARAASYARELKRRGGNRIVIRGRLPKHASKVEELFNSLQACGCRVVMYTGVWGGVDISQSQTFLDWAQRDKSGNPLGYRGSRRSGMLCPESPYTEQVLIPEVSEMLARCPFDAVFFDIPWFMKTGCECKWCRRARESGATNDDIIRTALRSIVDRLRQQCPDVNFAVNASAPGLNYDNWTGAHLRNLAGIFDEYVTEWNPYRWGQGANAVANCIAEAKGITTGQFSHATTLTTRSHELLSVEQIRSLFVAILSQGATPWLGIHFSSRALNTIWEAYLAAQDEIEMPTSKFYRGGPNDEWHVQ